MQRAPIETLANRRRLPFIRHCAPLAPRAGNDARRILLSPDIAIAIQLLSQRDVLLSRAIPIGIDCDLKSDAFVIADIF